MLRATIAAALLTAAGISAQSLPKSETVAPSDFRQDFDWAVQRIAGTYAYFDLKATRWNDVPALYAADLQKVTTREHFIELLERVVDELYDPHAQLTVNLERSPRLVPSGTDLWAEWQQGRATIMQVREDSDATRAGLAPGTIVLAIDGVPVADAVEARLGRSYAHSVLPARDWALRSVLAGRHNAVRSLQVQDRGVTRTVELPATDQVARGGELVDSSESRPGIGYIRLNDSLGDRSVVAAFDRALDRLRSTSGLIIDLRNTPGGGNSNAARGILGRFVSREQPYQKHVLPAEERDTGVRRSWFELVTPRGARYSRPVAVLVGRWTGSMGEGLAIGFDATGAGTIVGTAMAGLVGATMRLTLPRTGIGINLPSERLYHVDGKPREGFQPRVAVDIARARSDRDPFIEAAVQVLRPR